MEVCQPFDLVPRAAVLMLMYLPHPPACQLLGVGIFGTFMIFGICSCNDFVTAIVAAEGVVGGPLSCELLSCGSLSSGLLSLGLLSLELHFHVGCCRVGCCHVGCCRVGCCHVGCCLVWIAVEWATVEWVAVERHAMFQTQGTRPGRLGQRMPCKY